MNKAKHSSRNTYEICLEIECNLDDLEIVFFGTLICYKGDMLCYSRNVASSPLF